MNSPAPSKPAHDDHPELSAANARSGLVLFFIYLAFYAGFMGLAAFAPGAMGRPVLAGVNLAITYGMGLIVGALVIAALYMAACARNARSYGEREASASRSGDITGRRPSQNDGARPAARREDRR
jgi:uncharacterized membrane protein (DUF485 family)